MAHQATPFRSAMELSDFIVGGRFMSELMTVVTRLQRSRVTVLITGETGTGKEKLAQAIHVESERRDGPFVPINIQAFSPSLVDSQLFGHKKGSFTGASQDFPGVIHSADGGTLLLDEIGELDSSIQVKLLRFLQDGQIFPLGATRPMQTDVRVIASTNRDLEREILERRFREDLFYRLSTFHIQVPPLRERQDEIPALIEHYLTKFSRQEKKPPLGLHQEALQLLLDYPFPGNIRELCNVIWRLVVLAEPGEKKLTPEHLPARLRQPERARAVRDQPCYRIPQDITYREAVRQLEKQMLPRTLDRNHHNLSRAADSLGLTPKGLRSKLKRLGFYESSRCHVPYRSQDGRSNARCSSQE